MFAVIDAAHKWLETMGNIEGKHGRSAASGFWSWFGGGDGDDSAGDGGGVGDGGGGSGD